MVSENYLYSRTNNKVQRALTFLFIIHPPLNEPELFLQELKMKKSKERLIQCGNCDAKVFQKDVNENGECTYCGKEFISKSALKKQEKEDIRKAEKVIFIVK